MLRAGGVGCMLPGAAYFVLRVRGRVQQLPGVAPFGY